MHSSLGKSYWLVAVLCLMVGCAQRRDIAQTLRVNFSPRGTPQILAAYQPWFGKPNHINVGYSSQDPAVLAGQIEKAKNLGITGFVVNWYGRRDPFEDESYRRLQEVASQHDFSAALMYDESEDQQHSTDDAIRDLQYAYQNYIGPMAPTHGAYLSYDGRPLIFVFPKGGRTDWRKVRAAVNDWAAWMGSLRGCILGGRDGRQMAAIGAANTWTIFIRRCLRNILTSWRSGLPGLDSTTGMPPGRAIAT